MGKLLLQLIGTTIIYLISNYGMFYISSSVFGYSPSGIMYTLFYILIGLVAITIEKVIFSEYKGHFIATILIIGLSILFYYYI